MMFSPSSELDVERLKTQTIRLGEKSYSFGLKPDLTEHLSMLEREFSGQTQLEFFHAATTVFIRRGLNLEKTTKNFKLLWQNEGAFLCENLDTRWLVSACDTIIDIYDDPAEILMAFAGTLFMNTIKLYETERAAHNYDTSATKADYRGGRVPLFDGMSAYMPFNGDMIENLLNRVKNAEQDSIAAQILDELIKRAHRHDTVFRRFQTLRQSAQNRGAG